MKLIAIDPGLKNFGVAIMENGLIETLSPDITIPAKFNIQEDFSNFVKSIKKAFKPILKRTSYLFVERMMPRSRTGTMEVANVIIGCIISQAPSLCHVHLIPPVSWKNWLKRQVDVNKFQTCSNCAKEARCDLKPRTDCVLYKEKYPWSYMAVQELGGVALDNPHQADAVGLLLYGVATFNLE